MQVLCNHNVVQHRHLLVEDGAVLIEVGHLQPGAEPHRAGLRRQMAEQQGFVTLADDGLRRVLDGSTSLEELGRVVDLTGKM